MITKLHSYGMAIILALCCSLNLSAQGYSDSSIKKVGDDRDSSKDSENITVRSSSNTRSGDVTFIFIGQSDSDSLEDVRPSGISRMTEEGSRDLSLKTYYYEHNRSGSKSFDFGSHKRAFAYLLTLRNVDLDALRGMSSSYLWTDANTNHRFYGNNFEWRGGCRKGTNSGLGYVNKELKSYNKGVQVAVVMYDDNPTDIGIYRGRTSNTKIMDVIESWKQGDDAMAIGMKTTDGERTKELHFRGGECVGGHGENALASFTLKPASSSNDDDEDPVTDNGNWLIDNCDSSSGWSSSNTKSISSNYKEGRGSLKSRGSRTDDFKRTFNTTNGQGATALEFWYYVDNPSRFSSTNQVELSSSGRADRDEYSWSIDKSKLNRGWNLIKLPFRDARVSGNPDIKRLNWFRLYRRKTGTTTSRIDFIRLTNSNSSSKAQNSVGLASNLEDDYIVYPNPSKGEINLILPIDGDNDNASVSITNILGQTVFTKKFNGLRKGNNQISFDPQLSPALYFVIIQAKESRRVLKLLVSE